MTDDLRRRVVDAMLAVDVENGGKADMYMLADAAITETFRALGISPDSAAAICRIVKEHAAPLKRLAGK